MIRLPALLKTGLAAGAAVALLMTGSVLLDAGARVSSGSKAEPRIIGSVQRVVAPPSEAELLPDLVDAACPAIVSVTDAASPPGDAGRADGIVISGDGAILMGSESLKRGEAVDVAFNDGTIRAGQVTVTDDLSGLAIVQVEATGLVFLAFDDTDLPRPGEWGFVLSSPAGRGCLAEADIITQDFTSGPDASEGWVAISTARRAIGLPFLGRDGRVKAFSSRVSGTVRFMPGNILSRIAATMVRTGEPPVAAFGMLVEKPGPAMTRRLRAERSRGAVVVLVGLKTPASRAGLLAGDIILTAGGAPVAAPSELERILAGAGESISLGVHRRGRLMTVRLHRAKSGQQHLPARAT
jgi:serine protease Do